MKEFAEHQRSRTLVYLLVRPEGEHDQWRANLDNELTTS